MPDTDQKFQLVHVRKNKPFKHDETEEVLYELRYGDFVHVQSSGSANPGWHSREQYEESSYLRSGNQNGENILSEASIRVTLEGGFIGCFADYDDFVRHIEYYMRGEILEVVDGD